MEGQHKEVDGTDLTEDQKSVISQEDKYRRMFAEDRNNQELNDPHLQLIDVFGISKTKWNFEEESNAEKKVPKLLKHWRESDRIGQSAIVNSEADFRSNWDEFTCGMFKDMDWSHVFCAGGAVLANVLKGDNVKDMYADSDIDLFVYGVNEKEANERLKHIHAVITKNTNGGGNVIRTRRTITIINTYPNRHVQVILKIYKSPAEVLLGFDVDCCSFGYDGNKVWSMERARRSVVKRYNVVNMTRRSGTYEKRLVKYAKRGFTIVVPKLDRSTVDERIFYKKPWEVHGLAKLLVIDYRSDHPELFSASNWREKDGPESDYTGDLEIPWGPGWNSSYILDTLNAQDKSQFFAHKFRVARSSAQSTKFRKEKAEEAAAEAAAESSSTGAVKGHKHLFITGIDEVISGGHFWCDICNQKMEMLPEGEERDDKEWNNFVPKKVIWVTESPAYQDYDNGYKRKMITGSFNPVLDQDWDAGVYAPQGHKRGPLPHEGRETTPNVHVDKEPAKWVPRVSHAALPSRVIPTRTTTEEQTSAPLGGAQADGSYKCEICDATFYSQNQLRKHIRLSGHIKPSDSSEGSSTGSSGVSTTATTPSGKTETITLESVVKHGTLQEYDNQTRALLLLSLCARSGKITEEEHTILKESFVRTDEIMDAAVQVFMIDRDLSELVDTFKKIASNLEK